MVKKLGLTIGAVLALAGALPTHAQTSGSTSTSGVRIGTLSCDVASGWGLILGSSKNISCDYSTAAGNVEHYDGSISKLGADIGYTSNGKIIWSVIAPTSNVAPGSLAGNYAGVTASAAVGAGGGANVLIGGSNKTISLQPISVQGMTGLNVAAGVGAVNLKYAKG